MRYLKRIVDDVLVKRLDALGTVAISGASGCGKTTTGQHFAASYVDLASNPDQIATAQVAPRLILEGSHPRFIDEWHPEPISSKRIMITLPQRRQPQVRLQRK